MRSFIAALLSVSLVASPIAAAAANPAEPLSVAGARAGAETTDAQYATDNTWIFVGLGILVAAILLIVLLDDDDEDSDSP